MKKLQASLLSLMMCVSMAACSSTSTASSSSDGKYTAGTYTGQANGYGGTVTVEVTTDSSSITDVTITGDKETPEFGGKALDELKEQILAAQSGDIDGVSYASLTTNAVKLATSAALKEAEGGGSADAGALMKPGTYNASAWGFSQVREVPVTVEVSEDAITSITVDTKAAKETGWYLQSAIDNMIPRILDQQSVAVDSETGATTSSSAIKTAVRDCLSQAYVANGQDASAEARFETIPEKEAKEETIDVDVVVVGMGGTGSATALRVAELQKEAGQEVSVLGLEKAGTYGGTSASTTSLLAFNSETTIEEFGDEYRTDTTGVVDFLEQSKILGVDNKYAEWYWNDIFTTSGPLVDWLIEHGFYFGAPRKGFWGDYATQYYYGDSQGEANLTTIHDYFDIMIQDYKDLGGQLMTETEGTELLTDSEGNVTGVKAYNWATGTTYTINAKAVMLAAGGFGGNSEMMKEYNGGDYWLLGDAQNDGVMMEAAMDLGANTLGMTSNLWGGVHNISTNPQLHTFDYIFAEDGTIDQWRDDVAAYSLNDVPNIIVASYDSIWVSKDGTRKTNEAGMWNWPNAGDTYYAVVDQDWIDNVAKNGFTENHVELFCNAGYNTFPLNQGIDTLEEGHTMQDVLDECEKAGILVTASSVEELAEKLEMDPATLTATMDTYNEACESGTDAEQGKDAKYLTAIDGDKYYAFKAAPRPYSSVGGLDVNETLQVVKTDDTVINGLWAGGTDCLGATAPAFGGELQVWAYLSGYLAAENIVETIQK